MQFYLFWNILQNTYIFIMAAWLAAAVLLKNHRHYKKCMMISAFLYAIVLLYITLLGRTVKSEYQMELSFLWEYRLALQGQAGWWMQIFDNIMLFVPMGYLFGVLKNRSSWKGALIFGACASLLIELSQLVSRLGMFEFDDILNNTLGMLLGYGIARIFVQ